MRPVHLAMPCPYPRAHIPVCAGPVACYGVDICRPRKWKRTTDPLEVTCARCPKTPARQGGTS